MFSIMSYIFSSAIWHKAITSKAITKQFCYSSSRCFCTKKDDDSSNLLPKDAIKPLSSKIIKEPKQKMKNVKHSDVEGESGNSSRKKNSNDGKLIAENVKVEKLKQQNVNFAAKKKILTLLSGIKGQEKENRNGYNLNLAKPQQRINKRKLENSDTDKNENYRRGQTVNHKIMSAVKDIASTIGGDSKEIESELKKGLSISGLKREPLILPEKQEAQVEEEIGENMMSAVKAVASTISGDPGETQSELTKKLLALAQRKGDVVSEVDKAGMMSMFEGMKIERTESTDISRSKHTQKSTVLHERERSVSSRAFSKEKVIISNAVPLNIFPVDNTVPQNLENFTSVRLLLWDKLQETELKSLVQFSPTNAFEEMIQWTEQGKHWKFPIDNEIDMGNEEKVGFHEHVFLEQHLDGFPKKGPIRHFMELVITGLSKNPYITVERKKENIEWFRQYFKEKEDILKECGALG